MRRIINHVKHHARKHGKAVHQHMKKHHHKYIFGAISGALVYKTLALILTTVAVTPMGHSFASGAEAGTGYTGAVLAGDFVINNDDSSTTGLDVVLNNDLTGVTHMRFGNTESERNLSAWDAYSNTQNWVLDDNGTGVKTVYAQFSGYNVSGENTILDLNDTIEYILEASTNTGSTETNTGSAEENTGFVVDVMPDSFDFTDITDASLTTEYYSDTKLISGINTGSEVSISDGTYKINSDSRTSTTGIINSGDTIQVKLFSDDNYSTEKSLILSIGDLDVDWSVTTTGDNTQANTGSTETNTGSTEESTGSGSSSESSSNGICDSTDITILNPLSGNIVKGEFDISWEYNNTDCNSDEFTVKLRDANTQYITLDTVVISNQTSTGSTGGLIFDSSMLYSGFYNIYSGVDLSGNNILIYTGQYTGLNTKFFSGHKIAILNTSNDIMYEGDEFTIDNLKPELSNIAASVVNYQEINSKKYLNIGDTVNIEFDSSEELSGVKLNILGAYAIQESVNNNHYKYTLDLSGDNTQGILIYNIEFEDLAGNTGYVEGSDNDIVFDRENPLLTSILFTKSGSIIHLSAILNENSKLSFVYNISGSQDSGYSLQDETYMANHSYDFTGILANTDYNYTLSLQDYAGNIGYVGGVFKLSGDNIESTNQTISSGEMIVSVGFNSTGDVNTNTGDINTGNVSTGGNTLLGEINKFNVCKNTITDITVLEIPVRRYKARIEMPNLEKSYVRKLVSAFSIVLFDRIEKVGLTESQINDITKDFNQFLIILKLVRDNDDACKQSLSTYYMSKFRSSLLKYGLAE